MSSAEPLGQRRRQRRGATQTSRFGSSRRESHDSSPFYDRFAPAEETRDESVSRPRIVDEIICHDAREMWQIEPNSVALVVTSPPYFAGKEYEAALGSGGTPSTYVEYLELLEDVFAECKRVLEPGGRIAVNVANLGRRPYRSLSADVIGILEGLGYLLRGEVLWWKGRSASGSCAWGTFAHPANPVLRDVTERVVVASKGRFDRAVRPSERAHLGLPFRATITKDEFLDATTDLWEIPPESATRVGHPAPFPVELPVRLIELYTYEGDVVLDPFVGSGSTAVAAVRTGRRYLGFDTDESYVRLARQRVAAEASVALPGRSQLCKGICSQGSAAAAAEELLREAGFKDVAAKRSVPPGGIDVDLLARDQLGRQWAFDIAGGFTSVSGGLKRSETLFKAIASGSVIRALTEGDTSYVVFTTELPLPRSKGLRILESVTGPGSPIRDVIMHGEAGGLERLARYARGDS